MSNLVCFPVSVSPADVTQSQLRRIILMRRQVREAERELAREETAVRRALLSGAVVEPGRHIAALRTVKRGSVPATEVVKLIVK